jgi:hypothetical protein
MIDLLEGGIMGRLTGLPSRGVVIVGVLVFGLSNAFAAEEKHRTAEVTVKPGDCRRLVAHKPADDVAYKAGVDAYGRPVTPADLPGTQVIKAPNKITFSITYEALKDLGVSESSSLVTGEASVGEVSYDISKGRLEFNGQPLGDPEIAALAAACKSLGK